MASMPPTLGLIFLGCFELTINKTFTAIIKTTTATLAATHEAAKRLGVVHQFLRVSPLDKNFLHLVPKPLLDDRRMPSLVHLSGVLEQAAIERVGKYEPNSVFVGVVIEMALDAVLRQK